MCGKFSTDWDKAWTRFKKQGKKTIFSEFSPNKYVNRNPRPSNYPLSEEVDPIKGAERSNLMLWTSPTFTLGLAIVIVTFLMVYTILAPINRLSTWWAMAVLSGSIKLHKACKVRLPPRRGQVKVKIIRSFVKMVSKVISHAVTLGRKRSKESDNRGR
ncbi:unnamed protein product [Camellia sinensis]